MDESIKKLVELFNSPVRNIQYNEESTIIEFQNGQIVPLYGGTMELPIEIEKCSFCGYPSQYPLFTMNDKTFICKDCASLAIKTFLENNVNIDLELGNAFPDLQEQITKLGDNINTMADQNEPVK